MPNLAMMILIVITMNVVLNLGPVGQAQSSVDSLALQMNNVEDYFPTSDRNAVQIMGIVA